MNCFHFCIFELSKASSRLISPNPQRLWIAFIFVSLNYQKHHGDVPFDAVISCELLSFLYLWTIKSIGLFRPQVSSCVVNCFHFCIFELSKASTGTGWQESRGLWIAFIFVSLNYQKHQHNITKNVNYSCELLSFLYLWTIKSIESILRSFLFNVVNCFHFCIFELSKASSNFHIPNTFRLWIAFIFVSLNYQKHLHEPFQVTRQGCELLSFLYLWTIKSILFRSDLCKKQVVNCFHFCIFELSKASRYLYLSDI